MASACLCSGSIADARCYRDCPLSRPFIVALHNSSTATVRGRPLTAHRACFSNIPPSTRTSLLAALPFRPAFNDVSQFLCRRPLEGVLARCAMRSARHLGIPAERSVVVVLAILEDTFRVNVSVYFNFSRSLFTSSVVFSLICALTVK